MFILVGKLAMHLRHLVLIAAILTTAVGCHLGHEKKHEVFPIAPPEVPRELDKVILPDYIIEPPDILTITGINLLPKEPYGLNPLDWIQVSTIGLPEKLEINTTFQIQPNGTILLGPVFGDVTVVGLTLEKAREAIHKQISAAARDVEVLIQLNNFAPLQQIVGEHLVAPDGRVNLGSYGRVRVVGMTIEEATTAIEEHLSDTLEQPQVAVDVFAYNSKVYYVITQGAGLGDQVIVLPFKGNETALDAIGQIEGLTAVSSTEMWLARPTFQNETGPQTLPINWNAITKQGDATTNYQILPGDRLYVAQDKLVNIDNKFAKFFSPIERIMGATMLSTSAVQRIKFFNNRQNIGGGGFGF